MAAREFHGFLHNLFPNQGPGSDVGVLTHVRGDTEKGEFTEGLEPSRVPGAGRIEPGGEAQWASESGGIMRGTSGQVDWRIRADSGHSEFARVSWSVPFEGRPDVTCAMFRSDPNDAPASSQPPELEIVGLAHDEAGNPMWIGQAGPDGVLAEMVELAPYVMALPWSFFVTPPSFVTKPTVVFLVRFRAQAKSALSTFSSGGPTEDDGWMATFAFRMQTAARRGLAGAFPNFYYAKNGLETVGGTIMLKLGAGEVREVPLAELGNPPLGNFGERMRAANAYASSHGFVGGFPTYFDVNRPSGIACGTFLLRREAAEWRDVSWQELGRPDLDDIPARFRATQDYAVANGFVGGFPNLFHADKLAVAGKEIGEDMKHKAHASNRVCGTILLKPEWAQWTDLVVATDPA